MVLYGYPSLANGPTGPTGATGPTGSTGPTGPTGPICDDCVLASGKSGGQTIHGGTDSSEKLTLKSTSDVSETGKVEITSGGTIEQSDTSELKKCSKLRIAWPSDVCEGTYGGYILLAKAHAGGLVANSEISGRLTLSRGAVSAMDREDVYEVVSKSVYNSETFVVNVTKQSGNTFFDKLCKITYGGIVYHAIKLVSTGGEANNGLFFDGYATQPPVLIRSDSGSNESDYGFVGLKIQSDGNIWAGGDISALSFTDRTPAYNGDALAELKMISSDEKGNIDHKTLPEFVRHGEERDIGNMITIHTKAFQQILDRLEKIEAALEK